MGKDYFSFKEFKVLQRRSGLKVTTDACLFGAWTANYLNGKNGEVLEIGTGTGLLSLMIAQQFSGKITAIDVDSACVAEAKENFIQSPWSQQLQARHVSLQDFVATTLFDFVVSNPPFFENDLKSPSSSRNTALHSESLTLEEFFSGSWKLIREEGLVFLLVGIRRDGEVTDMAKRYALQTLRRAIVSHSPSHPPSRVMYVFIKGKSTLSMEDVMINIRDADGNYSHAFTELLRPYYLYL